MTSTFLGRGEVIAAPNVKKPNQIAMMKEMAAMDMQKKKDSTQMDHGDMDHDMDEMKQKEKATIQLQ